MSAKKYAGIGSQIVDDPEIEPLAEHIASKLAKLGYCLESGGALGMDSAFERGHGDNPKHIYLPYKNFKKNKSPLYTICEASKVMARKFHPAPHALNDNNISYLARDCYQVLGLALDEPVEFIICWTKTPEFGGTSQALRIAKAYNIPVYNLYFEEDVVKLSEFIKSISNV